MSHQVLLPREGKELQWASVVVVAFDPRKASLLSDVKVGHTSFLEPHDYKEAHKISQDCVQPEKTKEQNTPNKCRMQKSKLKMDI